MPKGREEFEALKVASHVISDRSICVSACILVIKTSALFLGFRVQGYYPWTMVSQYGNQ